MKIRGFCLCAFFILIAVAWHALLARTAAPDISFQTETLVPDTSNLPSFRFAAWLFTGATLGWALFSLGVVRLAWRELAKAFPEE